eukprot:603235_1
MGCCCRAEVAPEFESDADDSTDNKPDDKDNSKDNNEVILTSVDAVDDKEPILKQSPDNSQNTHTFEPIINDNLNEDAEEPLGDDKEPMLKVNNETSSDDDDEALLNPMEEDNGDHDMDTVPDIVDVKEDKSKSKSNSAQILPQNEEEEEENINILEKVDDDVSESDPNNEEVNLMDDETDDVGFKHDWHTGIVFDAANSQIVLNISDAVPNKQYTKRVSSQDLNVTSEEMRAKYYKIGNMLQNGEHTYSEIDDGASCKIMLSKDDDVYEFTAVEVKS